ncbi:MAG: carbohydrate kinase family protein [Pseudobutyrivibrio ruminis]|jgi:ribokinase|nr:carbohydrate kinase family protein [Pseudobutyrivibrio ruminis]
MSKFIVAGITQLETIVKVKEIPIKYEPYTGERDSIYISAGGDAFNESLALKWLGDEVEFMTVVGENEDLSIFNPANREVTLSTEYVLPIIKETPKEILLYDARRKAQRFEDLKDIRDADYNMMLVDPLVPKCDMMVLSNVNFCRPFIARAVDNNKKLAVKIHSFKRDKEIYNEDFLKNANILYFNDNSIDEEPYEFVKEMAGKYDPEIIILGQGENGAIIYDKNKDFTVHYDAVNTKQVVNNAGAGNALFACFLHYYLKTADSKLSIHKALLFASNKIGYMGTSNGFMTEEQLEQWDNLIWNPRGAR